MDKSLEYIRMCCKAEEIQKLWNIADGDLYTIVKKGKKAKVFILNDWETGNEISEHRSLYFWILRLDQLQEMIDWTKWECRIVKKDQFELHYINIAGEQRRTLVCGKTMEQLWLAFVMSEKYGRIWDEENEEWKTA